MVPNNFSSPPNIFISAAVLVFLFGQTAEAQVAPIIDGEREWGEPAIVVIFHLEGGMCSASVIAPRVVLTAKHCVIDYYGSGQVLDVSGFRVYVGDSFWSATEEYRVAEVRPSSGRDIENSDIALVILSDDFSPEHGLKRWAFEPHPDFRINATITAIGYGQTRFGDVTSAGYKYRRDGRVADIGPNLLWELGDAEFMSYGENTCQGDSGGPLLLDDVIVGIVSRSQEGCTGYGWVTRVSSFSDMIIEALEDTGACVPTNWETCNGVDDDCWQGIDDGLDETCGCRNGGAPSEELCDGVDNDCNGEIDDLEACACQGGEQPGNEVCDGVDNDCNGEIDEICARLGELCDEHTDCASGMCAELDGESVCTARCVSGVDICPDDGWCDGSSCEAGMCRPDRGNEPLGQFCSSNQECMSGFCASGEDSHLRCTRPCVFGGLDCYATEYCFIIERTCGSCEIWRGSSGQGFGEPCRNDDDCESAMCLIDGNEEACGEGCTYRYCTMSCGDDGECPDGSHCRERMCVRGPHSAMDEYCIDDEDCVDGSCVEHDSVLRCVMDCDDLGICEEGYECVDGPVCWIESSGVGDRCGTEGSSCGDGGTCVEIEDSLVCAISCSNVGECVSGFSCVPIDNDGYCIPSSIAVHIPDTSSEGGCACTLVGFRQGNGLHMVLLLLGLAAFLRRTRKHC